MNLKRTLAAFLVLSSPAAADTVLDAQKAAAAATIRLEKEDGSLAVSGVLVTTDGYFLTKASEVPKLEAMSLRLPDGTEARAREVRRNSRLDLVLGQVLGASVQTPVKWNESRSLATGQWLLAPRQGGRETRLGVVSARRREIKGGSAAIGIRMSEEKTAGGVKVTGIAEDSPAAAAGLLAGDVIVSIGGESVGEYRAVHEMIRNREPGDELEVEYLRGKAASKCKVRLASRNRVLSNWTGEDYANGGISIRTDNFQEIIQHDIPLGPGDMGGPVLNLQGQTVGINIARVDRVTTFALPMEVFWPSVQQWVEEDRHPPKARRG